MGVLAALSHSRGSHLESVDSAGFVKITRNDPVVEPASKIIEIRLNRVPFRVGHVFDFGIIIVGSKFIRDR
jgi:hypothetical protein